MNINLATQNKLKIDIAKKAINETNIWLKIIQEDFVEIQSDSSVEIAATSAKSIGEVLGKSIVKIDTGLHIKALNGFPSTYSKYVEKTLTSDDILSMLNGVSNRKAYYEEALAYYDHKRSAVKVFKTRTNGEIAIKKGKGLYCFDKIFKFENDSLPMGEYSYKEQLEKYSSQNWKRLINLIK